MFLDRIDDLVEQSVETGCDSSVIRDWIYRLVWSEYRLVSVERIKDWEFHQEISLGKNDDLLADLIKELIISLIGSEIWVSPIES